MGGQVVDGYKNEGANQTGLPKTDIVSYASKVSANGVTFVFVAHFRSSDTLNVCILP